MIIEKHTEEIQTNNTDLKKIKFGIDDSDSTVPLLIDFLSRLYSNPKQTLLWEYTSNALDSMKLAGKEDEPIKITLPNKLNPHFIVRDYGIGMDHEEVETIFSVALRSTKRDSNDSIGGYGVGKLVFSPYCGVMFLTTWKHGEKTIYQCRLKDGDGEIIPLHQEKSDEPQGVEIKIPVKESDFEFFQNRAKYSYSFLKTKPIIKGANVELGYDNHFQTDKFTLLTEHINSISSSAMATIGGIPFPINASSIGYNNSDFHNVIYRTPLVLHFEVGEINHTPSRDQLEYNDKTIAAINARLGEVKQYLSDYVEEECNYVEEECKKATTMHEARLNFIKFKADNNELKKLINRFDLENDFKFNGEKIKINFDYNELDKLNINSNLTRLENGRLKTSFGGYKYGEKIIVVPSGFSNHKRSRRIKKYLIDNGKRNINVFTGSDVELGLKKLEIPSDYVINIEDLDDPVIARSSGGGSGNYSSRTVKKSKVLELKDAAYPRSVEAWNEIDFDCENDSGIYTLIKYYKPANLKDNQDHYLARIIYELRNLDSDFKLLGVRTSEQAKVEGNSNMVELDDYLRSLMDELQGEAQTYKNISHNLNVSFYNPYYYIDVSEIDCDLLAFIQKEKGRYDRAKDDHLSGEMGVKYQLFEELCGYFGVQKLKHYSKRNSNKAVERFKKAKRVFKKRFPLYDSVKYQDKEIKNEYFTAMKFFRNNLTQKSRSRILAP